MKGEDDGRSPRRLLSDGGTPSYRLASYRLVRKWILKTKKQACRVLICLETNICFQNNSCRSVTRLQMCSPRQHFYAEL